MNNYIEIRIYDIFSLLKTMKFNLFPFQLTKMACTSLAYYLKRFVRFIFDLLAATIGLFYCSKKNYLPPTTDSLLLEPAISLSEKIKKGQVSL